VLACVMWYLFLFEKVWVPPRDFFGEEPTTDLYSLDLVS
jgi:hypothetical protein